jgi:hypothetical protein
MQNQDWLNSIEEPKIISNDDLAKQELKAQFGKTNRNEKTKKILHKIFLAFVYCVSIVGIIIVCIRLIHLVINKDFQWLSEEQIQSIDKLFFSGAIGGFIANYVKKASD